MKNRAPYCVLFTVMFSLLCLPALASSWQICRMQLRITDVVTNPFPKLQAEILKVSAKAATVVCPEQGTTLMFTP